MKIMKIALFFSLFLCILTATAQSNTAPANLSTNELDRFTKNPELVQELITKALAMTKQNLRYQFGSANPKNGGMDCSGAIYYLLQSMNQMSVPRQSDQIYAWGLKKGNFHPVKGHALDSKEFAKLKPGDLLYWTGTYPVKREYPITHVMLYLGKDKQGKPLMFGASNGRTFRGRKIWGVSVFDFKLPRVGSKSHFIGYSCIPNVNCDA